MVVAILPMLVALVVVGSIVAIVSIVVLAQLAGLPRAVDRTVRRGSDDRFTLVQLLDGVVVGGVTVNQGRDMRPLQQLIAKAARPDLARLADPAAALAQLAKGA